LQRDRIAQALHLDPLSTDAELAINETAHALSTYEATRRDGVTPSQSIRLLGKLKRDLQPLAEGRALRKRDRERRIKVLRAVVDPAVSLPEFSFDALAARAEELFRRLTADTDCVQAASELLQATESQVQLLKLWQRDGRKVEPAVEAKRDLCAAIRQRVWERFSAGSARGDLKARREFVRLILDEAKIVHPGKTHNDLLDAWIDTEVTFPATRDR
jgi:hypothetical protein